MACIFTFLKTYVLASGHGSVGGFFGAYACVAVLLRVLLGWIPDRLGAERVLGPALASYAAGLALLASASSDAHVVAAGVLCGVGHGYTYPILFGLVIGRAREAERGAAMAVYTAIDASGGVVAGPLLGSAIEASGYPFALGMVAAVLVSVAVGFRLWDRSVGGTKLLTP
jgi:MFS family permease